MATVQNVLGAFPVKARDPPPEGQMAVPIQFTLTPAIFSSIQSLLLGSQSGGILMSQVVTLVIDNSASPYPTTVVHGATFASVTIPAFTESIVPTFSQTGNYYLSVSQATAPVGNVPIKITLLNYDRAVGSYSEIMPNTQQASSIYSFHGNVIASGNTPVIPIPSNFALVDLELMIPLLGAAAAGLVSADCILLSGATFDITSLYAPAIAPGAGPIATDKVSRRTFATPLYLPRGQIIQLNMNLNANCNVAHFVLNLSGFTL